MPAIVNQVKIPMDGEVIGPRGDIVLLFLVNRCDVKVPSEFLCLYPSMLLQNKRGIEAALVSLGHKRALQQNISKVSAKHLGFDSFWLVV